MDRAEGWRAKPQRREGLVTRCLSVQVFFLDDRKGESRNELWRRPISTIERNGVCSPIELSISFVLCSAS